MYYKEFLRVRRLFVGFAITIVAIMLFILLLSGHSHVNVSSMAPSHHAGMVAEAGANDRTNIRGPGIEVSDAGHGFPFAVLFAIAAVAAAIFATILGCFLATENNGHLEIAWTRPASRTQYALAAVVADVIGILAAFAFVVLVEAVLFSLKGWWHFAYMDPSFYPTLGRFLLYPLAWYGLVAGITASMRGGGLAAGLAWPAASILIVLSSLNLPPAIHTILGLLDYLNPMMYGTYAAGNEAARHVMMMSPADATLGLVGITVLGLCAALVQWRRLEA